MCNFVIFIRNEIVFLLSVNNQDFYLDIADRVS